MGMDLSIIIVNWNSRDYLKKCIASILSEMRDVEFEIVVIDGASFDGCDKMLREYYPQVRFIQSERNLGFAKANNEAFKLSCGRHLLFLNPDTEIEGDSVQVLLNHLESLPGAGCVGPRLLNTDKSIQTSCIRKFPTILNQVLDAEVLKKWFPLSGLWGMAPLFDRFETPVEVDAVSGACLMINRSVFKAVGSFSVDYFMYAEDIDLCYKIRKAGWKSYFVPMAAIIHHGGGSSSKNDVNTFSSIMMVESRWRFFRKTHSIQYSGFYRFAMFIAAIIRTGVMLVIWPALAVHGKASLIEAPLKKWIGIMRWTFGIENWVKKY